MARKRIQRRTDLVRIKLDFVVKLSAQVDSVPRNVVDVVLDTLEESDHWPQMDVVGIMPGASIKAALDYRKAKIEADDDREEIQPGDYRYYTPPRVR
jgi:hypothetical protein